MAKGDHYPVYDPSKTYRADERLYAERLCSCGSILRVRARARHMVRIVAEWHAKHPSGGENRGEKHHPTDRAGAWAAREEKRRSRAEQLGQEFTLRPPPPTFRID